MSKEEEFVELPQSDVSGFWDGEGTLNFKPAGFKSFPSKKFRGKTTTMIVGLLLKDTTGTDSDGEETKLEAGSTIGVWYSPGMRPLLTLKDQKIRMTRDEQLDKDTGKGNPMKGYAFQTLKNVQRIKLENLSVGNEPDISVQSEKSEPVDTDDLPF